MRTAKTGPDNRAVSLCASVVNLFVLAWRIGALVVNSIFSNVTRKKIEWREWIIFPHSVFLLTVGAAGPATGSAHSFF